MPWIKLIIEAKEVSPGNVELLLETLGADAVSLEDAGNDPQLEPGVGEMPLWRETRVSGLFPAARDQAELEGALLAAWPGKQAPAYRLEILEDQDWALAWAEHAAPMRYGDHLWVCPDTEPHGEIPTTAVRVNIPPGLAFGTGSHPTTALCLEWLSESVRPGMTVMDYGCGSGILAVAAACLGAERIIAVDNDPQALLATRENARANGVLDRIEAYLPDDCPAREVDLLVANILANPLVQLSAALSRKLAPGAGLALTGILSEQAEQVAAAYRPWLPELSSRRRGEWILLEGTRRSAES